MSTVPPIHVTPEKADWGWAVEWGVDAALAGWYFSGAVDHIAPRTPMYGPQYTFGDGLGDLRTTGAGVLDRPYQPDTVTPLMVVGGALVGTAGVGLADHLKHGSWSRTHDVVRGAVTTTLVAVNTAELLQASIGRLRPDFVARYDRAACLGYVDGAGGSCDGVTRSDDDAENQAEARDLLTEGMRSFPSAHATTSMAVSTYLALVTGADFVWAPGATRLERTAGVLAMGAMLGAGAFSASSRLGDNRHHAEDVAVGAVLGTTIGAATYFMRFDVHGDDGKSVQVGLSPTGAQVSGQF